MKKIDDNIQEELESNQPLDKKLSIAMKLGNKPYISDQRMEANRWQLKRTLRAESSKQSSLIGRFSFTLATNKLQIAGMFLTFTVGFLLASNEDVSGQIINDEANKIVYSKKENTNTVDARDQIINFKIDKNQNSTSPYKVKYTTLRQTKLNTNLEDRNTILLLTSAMETDLNDATRLELVDILKEHLENEEVRKSLSYSLLNDPNPGVRMIVAESLAKLSSSQSVRMTLRQALVKDTNQGVRISAFEGLLENLDDETINLFKSRSSQDSNYYIRTKAKSIVEEIKQKKDLERRSI
ncbi:MAG: hypothetical protein COA86_01630 [Kangiella sp.]|nr:MAG: hypothetical protein COA86_01630 [Kangiella sp.]